MKRYFIKWVNTPIANNQVASSPCIGYEGMGVRQFTEDTLTSPDALKWGFRDREWAEATIQSTILLFKLNEDPNRWWDSELSVVEVDF